MSQKYIIEGLDGYGKPVREVVEVPDDGTPVTTENTFTVVGAPVVTSEGITLPCVKGFHPELLPDVEE